MEAPSCDPWSKFCDDPRKNATAFLAFAAKHIASEFHCSIDNDRYDLKTFKPEYFDK
jgi:hypothetical protein